MYRHTLFSKVGEVCVLDACTPPAAQIKVRQNERVCCASVDNNNNNNNNNNDDDNGD